MPPPTPSKTFMTSELAGESACPTFSLGRREFLGLPFDRVRVLHQASPDFFHGSDGGLLGCGWEERTSAILQLPRALGRDDDEAVGALFDVIGNGVHRVISQSLSHLSTSILSKLKTFQDRPDLFFHPGLAQPLRLHDGRQTGGRLIDFPVDQHIIILRVVPNFLRRTLQAPLDHFLAILRPRAEPLLENFPGRWKHKDTNRFRNRYFQLSRTLDIDVEYQVAALLGGLLEGAPVGAVVVLENLSIFKELRLGQAFLELLTGDEDIVNAVGFSWARGAGSVGNREGQVGNRCHEPVDQRGLSGAGGGGDDEDGNHCGAAPLVRAGPPGPARRESSKMPAGRRGRRPRTRGSSPQWWLVNGRRGRRCTVIIPDLGPVRGFFRYRPWRPAPNR